MSLCISSMVAIEILDSRGRPTLRVHATLADGRSVASGCPLGRQPGAERRSSCATTMRTGIRDSVCSRRSRTSTGRLRMR